LEKPLINILTRTSGRPKYFQKCFESVNNQTYKNINHLISVDDDFSEEYVKKYTDNYIRVEKFKGNIPNIDKTGTRRKAPYNLYCNSLKNRVTEGWVMFLDDDDEFLKATALEEISEYLKDENSLLLWKVKFPNTIIPNDSLFKKKIVMMNNISAIGFMYNKKWNKFADWDYFSGGDFVVIDRLYKNLPNSIWIDEIYTSIQRNDSMGGKGKKDDLK
jgi:glycosyltransferase involved in cell wall biosynthesis